MQETADAVGRRNEPDCGIGRASTGKGLTSKGVKQDRKVGRDAAGAAGKPCPEIAHEELERGWAGVRFVHGSGRS